MTKDERDRWIRMRQKREESLGSAFATKIDLERAMRGSEVSADGLAANVARSNEEELAQIMATAEKDASRARLRAEAARRSHDLDE